MFGRGQCSISEVFCLWWWCGYSGVSDPTSHIHSYPYNISVTWLNICLTDVLFPEGLLLLSVVPTGLLYARRRGVASKIRMLMIYLLLFWGFISASSSNTTSLSIIQYSCEFSIIFFCNCWMSQAVIEKTNVNPSEVGDIVVGSVLAPGSQRASECRMAAFYAGFPGIKL